MQVICRKDRVTKDRRAPVFIRFTKNRKVRYISTGVAVRIDDWDFENQCIRSDSPEMQSIQFQIDSKVEDYRRRMRRLEALEVEVTLETLFESKSRRIKCTVSDCFEREIARLESLGKYNSASKVKTVFSLIGQFRNADIRLEEIDLVYLNDLELFLRKRGNKDNSIASKFSVFKAIYNKALAEELFAPKVNPFVKFKVGRLWTATRKRAITKEELRRIIDFGLPESASPYLILARDIFLFTYFTAGINIGDIARLEYRNIRNGRIYYTRRKTGKNISCQLMPVASAIIAKYSRPDHSETDYIFPILNKAMHMTDLQQYNRLHKVTAKINRELGELAKLAGIETHLTTYVARHTYATVLKRSGVNIAIISESLGHSDLATTQIYLDSFENSQIDEAMKHLL